MSIKVLIVEDEILVAEDIAADLEQAGFAVAGIAISSAECMSIVTSNRPDIVLMDINIKGDIDGIGTAKMLLAVEQLPIIYLTANTDKATVDRALQTAPHAFISKPFKAKDLIIAIELACNAYNQKVIETPQQVSGSVFVKKGEFHHRIQLDDICYVAAAGSYCHIYTKDDLYVLSSNLQHFELEVVDSRFIRTHRSYVVNAEKVEGFNHEGVLVNEKNIPISKSNREAVLARFKKL